MTGTPTTKGVADISVVIPVLNDRDDLLRCLGALARQTVQPAEVIVVDNASTDDSARIARQAGVDVVYERHRGIGWASATGYDRASSTVIARLDADSRPPRHWIETIDALMAARHDLDAVTGTARFHDGPRILRYLGARAYLTPYFVSLYPALGHPPLFGSNFAMRREVWQTVRGSTHIEDQQLHDDLDLSFHLKPHHRVGYDSRLEVAISARPFMAGRSWRTRFLRGVRTVTRHWPEEYPWRRWRRRRAASREARRGSATKV